MNQDPKAAMAFSCVHEVQPKLSTETQQLYDYAHYHDLHNLWLPKDGVWEAMAPYYRIAAANGDYKANLRLQYLLTTKKQLQEFLRLSVLLLSKNVPMMKQ